MHALEHTADQTDASISSRAIALFRDVEGAPD
jgi:hypothetical protein